MIRNPFKKVEVDPWVETRDRLEAEKRQQNLRNFEVESRQKMGLPEMPAEAPVAGKRKGLIGKALGATGAVLNSPLLFAAPMLLPMIPGMSGASDPTYEEKMMDYQPSPDRQMKLDAQQQLMIQQQQAMALARGL